MASIPKPNNGRPAVISVTKVYLESEAHYNRIREKKGPGIFLSRHEIWGVIDEEVIEFKAACHSDPNNMEKELFDIITACVQGIASIRSGAMHW